MQGHRAWECRSQHLALHEVALGADFEFVLEQFLQQRGGDVQDVVIRQLLAVALFKILVPLAVKRAGLMRVLAITKLAHERLADAEGRRTLLLLVQEIRNRAIILGSGDMDLDPQET